MSYFAEMCEHMTATISLLPSMLRNRFDKAIVLSSEFHVAYGHSNELEPILDPSDGNGPSPRDLSRPVNLAVIADMGEDATGPAGYYGFHARTATRKELRGAGRIPFLSPYPHVNTTLAILPPYERTRDFVTGFMGYHPREHRWLRWGPAFERPMRDAILHERMQMFVSLQFSRRYDWHVLMAAHQHAPRIAIGCKAESARKVFALRDLPPGRKRRAALRHWVSEHYRNLKAPEPTGVRSHFRGAENFDWAGLCCAIEPSEYDRDRVGNKPDQALLSSKK